MLFRHGPTDVNESGRFQGWSDADLGSRGQRIVEAAVRRLVAVLGVRGIGTVVSSDLPRARQTAAFLPAAHIIVEPRLRELNFGAFEGRTEGELREAEDPAYVAWLDDPVLCPPPAGESLHMFRARVVEWWDDLRPQVPSRSADEGRPPVAVVVVTHGGPIGVLLDRSLAAEDPARDAVPMPGGYVVLGREVSTSEIGPRPGSAVWRVEASHRCFLPESRPLRGDRA